MKKIIPYILIFIIVLQLFAPFSVGLNNKKIEINKNVASAIGNIAETDLTPTEAASRTSLKQDCLVNGLRTIKSGYCFDATWATVHSTINVSVYSITRSDTGGNALTVGLVIKDPTGKVVAPSNSISSNSLVINEDLALKATYSGADANAYYGGSMTRLTGGVTGLTANTHYTFEVSFAGPGIPTNQVEVIKDVYYTDTGVAATGTGQQTTANASDVAVNNTGTLPACSMLWGDGTPMGCLAQGLYYILFRPTSFFFGLAGQAMDFTLMYSINDNSYRDSFVTQGWGVVRDFCNMFFIFVLLYIAFGTILNLHGVKTKEMIINVVIIGLLMNFSLFAAQVIIDASNILARVFYNQNTIVTGTAVKDASGNTTSVTSQLGNFGEIKLSEAIVSKVDPQKLIINSQKVDSIQIKDSANNEDKNPTGGGITTGSFILITLLATAVNIVGLIAFLSCAIIFISRVVGLWLAMILVPIAFFSYTVPALSSIKMIGWQHWWPDTLKLAFLAPVFCFFMYIIVGFMNKGLGVIDADKYTGLSFVVAIAIPFVFVMILLMKAKDIASDMSGEIGQAFTGAIKTVGGIALGGAALGGAALGRKVIGQGLASASRTEGAKKYATEKIAFNDKLDKWKDSGKIGAAPTWQQHRKENGVKWNPATILGGKLNEKQREVGMIDHARHEEDEIKKASGLEGVDNKHLSGDNIKTMENKFNQTKRSDAENAARKGVDIKGNEMILENENGDKFKGEEAFKVGNRKRIADQMKIDDPDSMDEKGELTDEAKKRVENKLNVELNAAVKVTADKKLADDFGHMIDNAQKHVNPITRGFSGANKSSYDVRKISDLKTDQREGAFAKIPIGLIAAVSAGVRGGIKSVGMSNGGIKVEGNFMKDLGNTISDSLKSMKVNVNLGDVGGHKSSADAHGGDAGHH